MFLLANKANLFHDNMNLWWWCFVGLFAISGMRESTAQSRNLCDICECLPSHAEPSYVNCNCKKNKVLIMNEEDEEVLSNAKVLNISTCTFVSFPSNGFPKAKKLRSVQIRQMGLFHFNAGTFPIASNLAIEDINELIIDPFLGHSNLVNIEIKNAVLSEISEDTFKELKSLERLIFHNVSINTIATNSLNMPSSNPKLSVKFVNCKMDTIQSESISLQVTKMELINTFMNVINSDGINISASDSIDIIRCTFGSIISPESFQFRSNKVNIVENEFKSLPSNLLREVHVLNDKKINFVGNTIHDVDFGGFILNSKLDKLNFAKNKIVCDCTPRKTSILKLRELFPGLLTNDSNFDTIIDNNSCKNYNSMPLSDFKRKFLSGALCTETDLKQLETMYEQSELLNLRQSSTEISPNNSVSLSSYCTYVFIVCILSNIFFTYAR